MVSRRHDIKQCLWKNTASRIHTVLTTSAGLGFLKFFGSIVVSIPACHAGDPGSIPGRRGFFFRILVAVISNSHQAEVVTGALYTFNCATAPPPPILVYPKSTHVVILQGTLRTEEATPPLPGPVPLRVVCVRSIFSFDLMTVVTLQHHWRRPRPAASPMHGSRRGGVRSGACGGWS